MNTTKVLREQSGIQYQGVSDKSEANPTDALVNFILAGEFKRGRFDRPMKITKANIRSKLGFDPTNKQYQAVEDTLNTGAPFVWVQRVSSGKPAGAPISCAGATQQIAIKNFKDMGGYNENRWQLNFTIEVDGKIYNEEFDDLSNWSSNEGSDMPFYIQPDSNGLFIIYLRGGNPDMRIRLTPTAEQAEYSDSFYDDDYGSYTNPTGSYENGVFSFCLSNPLISIEPS